VDKDKTYTFTKYVALARRGWDGDATATRALAQAARKSGFERLLADHRAAWHELWKSDIVVDGDSEGAARAAFRSYYLCRTQPSARLGRWARAR